MSIPSELGHLAELLDYLIGNSSVKLKNFYLIDSSFTLMNILVGNSKIFWLEIGI